MRSAYLKMTVATFLLGSYLIASKIILNEVPVFMATFVRLVSAAVVLFFFVAATSRSIPRFTRRDIVVLCAQSTLGVFLFSIFAMYGVRLTGGIESGVIMSTVPIAMSLIALVFFKERLTSVRTIGILLSVLGAASINMMSAHGSSSGSDVILGSLLLLGAVLCEAVFLTFGKFLSQPIAPAKLSLILAILGALLFSVPATIEMQSMNVAQISWEMWGLMIYTGVAINGLAVVLMYDAMRHVDTTVASAFTALTPVSGTILAVIFLKEELYSYHTIGIALVVFGVFLVASRKGQVRESVPAPAAQVIVQS